MKSLFQIWFVFSGIVVVSALSACSDDESGSSGELEFSSAELPVFDGEALVRPKDYREWMYVSTGAGMSYATTLTGTESMFDNVFVQRTAYEHFKREGLWPDKTVFVLELRASSDHGSILQHGQYQTDAVLIEASVKDSSRFKDTWAYFSFYPDEKGAIPKKVEKNPKAMCFSCHEQNAWVDNTFAQFYPTILPIAEDHGTVVNRPE
ncbi:MAG: cytochrome P460 family protein [Polyangiaceae bacterium]